MAEQKFKIIFLPLAQSDILDIISTYIMLGNKAGAVRMKDKINKAAEQIRFMPFSGPVVPDKKMADMGFRMIVVENYLMFYKVFEDNKTVLVYRVLNGKVNYPRLF